MHKYILFLFIALIVAVGGFAGGVKYQQTKQPTVQRQLFNGQPGMTRDQGAQDNPKSQNGGNRMGGQPVAGEIIAVDEISLTIKMQDGSSKIVILSDSTKINRSEQVEKTDLKTGENVMVVGTTNSDGTVTASSVQLNAAMVMFKQEDRNPTSTNNPEQ